MRIFRVLLNPVSLVFLLSSIAAPTFADTAPFMAKDVRFEGLMRVSPASLYAQLPINNGDKVDDAKIADLVRLLFKTGSFEDVVAAT
jgi:outer membrane protein insertion porin family